ncbi:hypothetical protein LTR28_013165 [Elasticomyces elasticus]|nr:hypothetical protein LTR28_013165 [Elasticomyces elasticus]
MMGSIRGNPDEQEQKALRMEISGLETMRFALLSSLSSLRARHTAQRRSHTLSGRCLNAFDFTFALYCLYRIVTTGLSSLRRSLRPADPPGAPAPAPTDPITNVLALLTAHYDSTLDRAARSRQISFLLSGVLLLASFNSVLQTFRLFARFFPSLLQHMRSSLPLIVSQIAATYVISSALLLRSNLPGEVGGVITEALGAPLEARFVERWFDGWFLVAVAATAVGIWGSRKMGGVDEWDEWDDGGADMEVGKRS